MSENIAGKVIVITGASSGLDEATVRRLAADGAKLMLGARRVDRLKALAAELELPKRRHWERFTALSTRPESHRRRLRRRGS